MKVCNRSICHRYRQASPLLMSWNSLSARICRTLGKSRPFSASESLSRAIYSMLTILWWIICRLWCAFGRCPPPCHRSGEVAKAEPVATVKVSSHRFWRCQFHAVTRYSAVAVINSTRLGASWSTLSGFSSRAVTSQSYYRWDQALPCRNSDRLKLFCYSCLASLVGPPIVTSLLLFSYYFFNL